MRTCANVAHGLGRGGGYEPLPEMGEYVCDCYEHGTGEPWAHVGSSHVHERVVRCRDCRFADETCDGMLDCNGPLVQTWDDYNDQPMRNPVRPNGFCAWGELRED